MAITFGKHIRASDISCPCKGCEDRSVSCHAECVRYKEYRETVTAAKKAERQKTGGDSMVTAYKIVAMRRIRKAQGLDRRK